jgi:Zn-dependent M28 family amino/carboxypeptidase
MDLIARGEEHSTLGVTARAAASAQGYRLSVDPEPEQVSFIRSDQFSFILRGIPSIVIGGGYKARDKKIDAAALRDEFMKNNYHQPSDQTNLPMDFAGAADLTRVNLRMLWDVANSQNPPSWKPNDFFSNKFPHAR